MSNPFYPNSILEIFLLYPEYSRESQTFFLSVAIFLIRCVLFFETLYPRIPDTKIAMRRQIYTLYPALYTGIFLTGKYSKLHLEEKTMLM